MSAKTEVCLISHQILQHNQCSKNGPLDGAPDLTGIPPLLPHLHSSPVIPVQVSALKGGSIGPLFALSSKKHLFTLLIAA